MTGYQDTCSPTKWRNSPKRRRASSGATAEVEAAVTLDEEKATQLSVSRTQPPLPEDGATANLWVVAEGNEEADEVEMSLHPVRVRREVIWFTTTLPVLPRRKPFIPPITTETDEE